MKSKTHTTVRRRLIALLLFPLWGLGGLFAQTGTGSADTVASSDTVVILRGSGYVPGCYNLYVLSSDRQSDGRLSWNAAAGTCDRLGARLPTAEELTCLCAHQADVPGGLRRKVYWSDQYLYTTDDGAVYYHALDMRTGRDKQLHKKAYTRCVRTVVSGLKPMNNE
jgi:hypothetical protein